MQIYNLFHIYEKFYYRLAATTLASRVFEFEGIDTEDKNSTKPSPDINLINYIALNYLKTSVKLLWNGEPNRFSSSQNLKLQTKNLITLYYRIAVNHFLIIVKLCSSCLIKQNRLISAVESVHSTEKSCIASYYRQFYTFVAQRGRNWFDFTIFHFDISGKLYIFCSSLSNICCHSCYLSGI